MTSAGDQKTYWGLFETVRWICTRDQERVAAMWNMSEEDAMAPALFSAPQWYLRSLQGLPETNSDADSEAAAPQDSKPRIDRPFMMDPSQAQDDLLRKLQSGRFRMTAIRCGGRSDEPTPVPLVKLNDLMIRLTPGHPVAPVGLWSRSERDTLVWRSPQFLRADVIRLWPARNTKTAAVGGAILRHLRQIMIPEAPLTKVEAQQRCLADVPGAYPGAFKEAWSELEPSRKRGRGKHGRRRIE
jgi:hypothetical protein